MMRGQKELGNTEIANRLGIEEIDTRMRNWPTLDFSEEQPKPMWGPMAAMFAIRSLALKELQKNDRQVAASKPSMPWEKRNLGRKYLLRPLRM